MGASVALQFLSMKIASLSPVLLYGFGMDTTDAFSTDDHTTQVRNISQPRSAPPTVSSIPCLSPWRSRITGNIAIRAFQKIEGMLQLHHEALAMPPSSALSRPPFEAVANSTHATASSPRSYELHGGGASISFPQVCLLFPCPLPLYHMVVVQGSAPEYRLLYRD